MLWTLDIGTLPSTRLGRGSFHYTAPFRDVEHGAIGPHETEGREHGWRHDDYQDIDLASLADDELVEQMHNDLYDGMARGDHRGHEHPARPRLGPDRVLNDALVEGMRIVGIDFRDGILFVPEVLLAANAMKAGMAILRPLLAETGAEADRQGRHRHRQGRHPRHRQEPRRDDARGRRLRGRTTSASTPTPTSSSPRSRSTSPTSSACPRCSRRRCRT